MGLVRKVVEITEEQDAWLREEAPRRGYPDASALLRDLIEWEAVIHPREGAGLDRLLDEGLASGLSERTVESVWDEARRAWSARRG